MKDYKYNKLQSLTRYLHYILYLLTLCSFFRILFLAFTYFLTTNNNAFNKDHFPKEFLENLGHIYLITCYIEIISIIMCAILSLKWIYRSIANLHSFNIPNVHYQPYQAVWCCILPIISFIAPYQIVSELWFKSFAVLDDKTCYKRNIISVWWICFLFNAPTYGMSYTWIQKDPFSPSGYITGIINCLLVTIAALLFIKITRAISQAQQTYAIMRPAPGETTETP